MALPVINTFKVTEEVISLYWKASPKSNIASWNIYGAPSLTVDFIPPHKGVVLPGSFTKIFDQLQNRDHPVTPGSCYIEFQRSDLGIGPYDPYYFILTSVDKTGAESTLSLNNLQGVPYGDNYFVDEAGQPLNVVYNNFEFDLWPLSGWDADRCLDIHKILGRPAKEIKIDTVGANIWVKFNSLANDPKSIRYGSPWQFDLKRGELQIFKVFVHNPTNNDATVRIFVAA